MVADLLADQASLAHILVHILVTFPLAKKQLAQERIQRFLLTAQFLAAAAVLLAQGAEEPFQNGQGTLLRVGFLGGGDKQSGVLGPVGRVLCQGSTGEDKGRCGQRGEVAVEGGDRLRTGSS